MVDAFDLPIKMVTFEQPSLYGRDSHRAVSVQSQGPSQFYSLSVSLLPHFKRWHIKELLVLDCIHLYTHLIICTVRDTRTQDAQRQNTPSQTNFTHICGYTRIKQRITRTTLQLSGWEVLADDIVQHCLICCLRCQLCCEIQPGGRKGETEQTRERVHESEKQRVGSEKGVKSYLVAEQRGLRGENKGRGNRGVGVRER